MMNFTRNWLNVEEKTRFDSRVIDCDCEYYVTGVIPGAENIVILKALERFIKALSYKVNTEDVIKCLEMMINCNEYGMEACYNEVQNGGGAYEIEINDYSDGSMSIYIRIAEISDPAEEAAEDPAEEAENKVIKSVKKDEHQEIEIRKNGGSFRVNIYGDSAAELCSSSSKYSSLLEAVEAFNYYCGIIGVSAE